ncbi:MAG: hypothetical protein AMJ93_15205 [Anaerolineae bacterium SM23_84]|nr:MAG: hypothetical protein AMJ93_15205 [Anaerolineae bacterium SM23_84]
MCSVIAVGSPFRSAAHKSQGFLLLLFYIFGFVLVNGLLMAIPLESPALDLNPTLRAHAPPQRLIAVGADAMEVAVMRAMLRRAERGSQRERLGGRLGNHDCFARAPGGITR